MWNVNENQSGCIKELFIAWLEKSDCSYVCVEINYGC